MNRIRALIIVVLPLLLLSCKESNLDISGSNRADNSNSTKPVFTNLNMQNISDLQSRLRSISKNETPSVVFIGTEKIIKQKMIDPFEFFFGYPNNRGPKSDVPEKEFKQEGLGSGVVYKKNGSDYFIITNNHVTEGADKIKITVDQKKFYDGKILGSDPRVDISVVKITTKDELQVAKFGDSDTITVGDFVIAIGNPFGLYGTMTFGIISAIGRSNINSDQVNLTSFIQTDAAINPGNSGGPLINISGEVIGINNMIYSQTGGSIGIGFAIPVNIAKKTADQIIEFGKVEHGYLGIYFQELTEESIKTLNLKNITYGMLVNQVFDDSPAEKAGILAGDVVLEVDGKKIRTSSDMVITIGNLSPGTKIQLKISRNGEIKNIPVTLGARDETQIASTVPEEKGSAFKKYGFELAELSATARNKYKIDKNISGVMILRVNPSGISKEAGLQAGDVITKINNKPVKNIEEVEKILKASENQSAYFIIYRDKKEFIVMM